MNGSAVKAPIELSPEAEEIIRDCTAKIRELCELLEEAFAPKDEEKLP
jgi:hypothetical protein